VSDVVSEPRSPKRDFRVLTRRRGGYDGAHMVDVQLQVASTGALVWAQTFSDETQADDFQRELEADLDTLEDGEFRRKYGVPASV
jgi:hypothetical protein